MIKKGLAIIYDPHNLYQFIWYYCNNDNNKKEWDALCLPNGYKSEYMHPFCEKANIFKEIYKDNTSFWTCSLTKKIKLFLQMIIFFVIGKRTLLCRKILSQYVDLDEYDEFVVLADVGLVSGACIALGKEKKVIILEDGINDYGKRLKHIPRNKLNSSYAWQGFLLSIMGYSSPGWFWLKTDKYCIKYCSQPEKMEYKNYKEMRLLYSDVGTNKILFDQVIKRIYPAINNYNFNKIEAVIMTRPLDDIVLNSKKYIQKLNTYISGKYACVLLKKHPRDGEVYNFGNETITLEADNTIPAEVLLPYLNGKDILIITTSSIIIYLKSYGLNCDIIMFDGMYEESLNNNVKAKMPSVEEVKGFADKFCSGCSNIIIL